MRLLAQHTPATQPHPVGAVVMLHGWEGDANALYMLSLARRLLARGFEILRLNLRDHGGTQQLNPGLFHSCLLPEVIGAVRRAQQHVQRLAAASGRLLARRQFPAAGRRRCGAGRP